MSWSCEGARDGLEDWRTIRVNLPSAESAKNWAKAYAQHALRIYKSVQLRIIAPDLSVYAKADVVDDSKRFRWIYAQAGTR